MVSCVVVSCCGQLCCCVVLWSVVLLCRVMTSCVVVSCCGQLCCRVVLWSVVLLCRVVVSCVVVSCCVVLLCHVMVSCVVVSCHGQLCCCVVLWSVVLLWAVAQEENLHARVDYTALFCSPALVHLTLCVCEEVIIAVFICIIGLTNQLIIYGTHFIYVSVFRHLNLLKNTPNSRYCFSLA